MSLLIKASILASALLATHTVAQCESYGIDFQSGGSYFQNITSSDDFTFVSLFEGCQNDTANNILVDPNGDEYQCTDTPLLPSDQNEISTCPLEKNQLFSGDWSVLIISNNGDADPIAYERDFYLTVGTPATYIYTPTLTVSSTTTPIVNVTVTSTQTFNTTTTFTKTVPSKTYSPTVTTTPQKVTTTTTKTVGTVSKTAHSVVPTVITITHTASCVIPAKQTFPDPTCTITPTLVHAAALSTSSAQAKFRRTRNNVPLDREVRIAERKARLAKKAVQKRSPDSSTTTVTDTNTADYSTTTVTSTAPASTMTVTAAASTTTTISTTTTVQSGQTTLPVVTVTAATPTVTKTRYTVKTTTVTTLTRTQTVSVTTTAVNIASASVCFVKGGHMT